MQLYDREKYNITLALKAYKNEMAKAELNKLRKLLIQQLANKKYKNN